MWKAIENSLFMVNFGFTKVYRHILHMTAMNVIVAQTYSFTRLLRLVDVKGNKKFIIHGKFWVSSILIIIVLSSMPWLRHFIAIRQSMTMCWMRNIHVYINISFIDVRKNSCVILFSRELKFYFHAGNGARVEIQRLRWRNLLIGHNLL